MFFALLKSSQDLAKSTLLKALQIERNNVDELEGFVTSLQQNNSAIAEMVKSRDLIIDELNERVAIFEEDKMVLKAALKQLQKEMKEEAPKTQNLINELKTAQQGAMRRCTCWLCTRLHSYSFWTRVCTELIFLLPIFLLAEVARLSTEIESIIDMHQNEISSLQQSILQKQSAINESETKHSEIGRYVDMLEERLANFSITRRDLEVRERECKKAEARVGQMENERESLRSKIEELEAERKEFKSVFEELGQELVTLRQENALLLEEKEALERGAQRSREALASLENNMKRLDQETKEWESKANALEIELNSTKSAAEQAYGGVQETKTQNENLRSQLEELRVMNKDLVDQIEAKDAEASSAKEQIKAKSSELGEKEAALKAKVDEMRANEAKVKEISAKLAQLEAELATRAAEVPISDERAKDQKRGTRFSGKSANEKTDITATNSTLYNNLNETAFPPGLRPTQPRMIEQPSKKRKVPLRRVRKLFSKATGIHNAFSRPSRKGTLKGPQPPRVNSSDQIKKSPHKSATAYPEEKQKVPLRRVRKVFAKPTGIHRAFSRP